VRERVVKIVPQIPIEIRKLCLQTRGGPDFNESESVPIVQNESGSISISLVDSDPKLKILQKRIGSFLLNPE